MKYLRTISPTIGADPEFFISTKKGKKIIESNKIIPEEGISLYKNSLCTRDGVQAEINPYPSACRQGAGGNYRNIFKSLAEFLSEKNAIMCLDSMIHFTQEELDKLTDDSKRFGCAPSLNYYTGKESVIKANPDYYGYRSAGGHIHLGVSPSSRRMNNFLWACIRKEPKLIVRLLDLVLGNTCVMIDIDSNQVERRTTYGRAGEYRLPEHGIEYRVLSNFWIKSYQLVAMVYGFSRLSLSIAYNILVDEKPDRYGKKSFEKSPFREILEKTEEKEVQDAINYNDFDLAKANWDKIKSTLVSMIPDGHLNHFPVNSTYLDAFEHFIAKGLDYWFKDDLITHWTKKLKTIYGAGWEMFLTNVVASDMEHNGNIEWCITGSGIEVNVLPSPSNIEESGLPLTNFPNS